MLQKLRLNNSSEHRKESQHMFEQDYLIWMNCLRISRTIADLFLPELN